MAHPFSDAKRVCATDVREHKRVIGGEFRRKALFVGGEAMEHYGLREEGDDTDFLVSVED